MSTPKRHRNVQRAKSSRAKSAGARTSYAECTGTATHPSVRERMEADLQLRGLAKRTHEGYLREVRKLACFYNQSPDQLSEQQVADYLLYLINDCEFAAGRSSGTHQPHSQTRIIRKIENSVDYPAPHVVGRQFFQQ